MCEKVKFQGRDVKVNSFLTYVNHTNEIFAGYFGFQNIFPVQYNVRVDVLNSYHRQNRGILYVDGFYEKNVFFHIPGQQLPLAVTYDVRYDFCIITKMAYSPVSLIHERQPIIIKEPSSWLLKGYIYSDNLNLERVV